MVERQFSALLRGAFAKVFEDESSITPELLKEQIYGDAPDMTLAAVRTLLGNVCNVMRQAGASNSAEPAALPGGDAQQQQLLSRFWAANREQAHRLLVERSRFQDTLERFEWRVDVKAASMGADTASRNAPTAIVEMATAGGGASTVHFELSAAQLRDFVAVVDDVHAALQEGSK